MKKVLFVATVVKTHIMVFHIPYIEWFKQKGYETHVCARNDYESKDECIIPFCDQYTDINFERFPFKLKNIRAYYQLKEIIEYNEYDVIHCHTPMGGVITRLAARKVREKGTKVIYTAHGFHFYRGAPVKNWILFYPVERWLARITDLLITINQEDYVIAQRFKTKKVEYVPGVGIDTHKFAGISSDRTVKRAQLGIPDGVVALLSVGELIKRKNFEIVIKAIAKLNKPNIIYLICGSGELDSHLKRMAKDLGVDVKFLGFRKDIPEICAISDIFVFPSYQEGLPVALMEAMATGLPVICSNIRGNTDLIEAGQGGYIVEPNDVEGFAQAIQTLTTDIRLREQMGGHNREVVKPFDVENTKRHMGNIYSEILAQISNRAL